MSFIDADATEMRELERLWDGLMRSDGADFFTLYIVGWTSGRTGEVFPPIPGMREGWVTMMRAYRVQLANDEAAAEAGTVA